MKQMKIVVGVILGIYLVYQALVWSTRSVCEENRDRAIAAEMMSMSHRMQPCPLGGVYTIHIDDGVLYVQCSLHGR